MTPARHRGGTPPVSIEVGAAYELLMSLSTFSESAHREVAEIGPEWFATVTERAGDDLLERLNALGRGNGDQFVHLIPLAYDAPAPRDVPTLLDHMARTDATEILLHVVGYYDYHVRRATPPEVVHAAVGGDPDAIAEFLRAASDYNEWRAFLGHALEIGPEAFKRDLIEVLRGWDEKVWRHEQPQVMPILECDADAKRALAHELPFERFVEVATNGVQYVAHPGIERVVLIPSYVNRPWVSSAEFRGAWLMVYPVADESLSADRDTPPLRLIRLSKALGDEKRLRILRALAERPRGLMDLASDFGLPKTTMHHHLVTLRSAGLVSVGAGTKEYRLRHDTLPDIAELLSGYIGSASGPSAGSVPAGSRRREADEVRQPARRRPPERVTG
jgi:DNA-binding transcriptional ArsR family regulator